MEDEITKNILDQIKSGQVKMHSRTYFFLRTFLSVVLVMLVAFLAWFFFSLVLFSLQRHGAFYVPLFGLAGIKAFFLSFPWFVFGLGVVLFILLDRLMSNYAVAYRRPALYTLLGVMGVIILCIGFVHAVGFNTRLHEFILAEKFPGIAKLYELSEEPLSRSILLGRIEEITEEGYVILTGEGETAVLHTSSETRYPNGRDLKRGETVIVGVEKNGENYSVYGVRKIERPIIKAIINRKVDKMR